ncbi:MAG: carbon-nitrogen hydrolase family protein [Ruminococcaceae bacterium]|nr:carbon-nitrogen hydrolase family protein [Oscillospiraceae bacterium]
MDTLNIALLQLLPGKTLEENLAIGLDGCRTAKAMGADLALFPEMWSTGYSIPTEEDALRSAAISADHPFVASFSALSRELDMAIGITFLEQYDPQPRNTLRLFDRFGRAVLTYAKVHTCDFGDECRLMPGEDFFVTDLDTAKGMVNVGAMICYDREFPESARILMLKGAELIVVPNACPMEINRLSQLRGRAYENMLAIATVNYPAPHPDCNGHSTVFDGVAYLPELPESRDTCIQEAGEGAGIWMARLNLETLRRYREEEVHGNAYRRPGKYTLLTEDRVDPPFCRWDKRR